MKKHSIKLTALLISGLISSPVYATTDWALSFGAQDMDVEGARPLEQAPNGSTSHTRGIQVAIHGESKAGADIKQRGYFKVFMDRDQDKLDPDHIPIWFTGSYQAKKTLHQFTKNTSLNLLFDADSKSNSVSSIERTIKLFAGINAEYNNRAFSAGLKTTIGRYALEIDDDVPKTRGYTRSDLKEIEYAYSITADTRIALGDAFGISLIAQTWQTGDQWLENQIKFKIDYDSNDWVKDSTFVVSVLHTEYNLESYNHEDKSAADYLPILPWNDDTLIQAYIIIPWDI